MTFDLKRYEEESGRLGREAAISDTTWQELGEAEGLEAPNRFLDSFAVVTAGMLQNEGPAWTAGIPMFMAFLVGLRIGRMDAAEALDADVGGGVSLKGREGVEGATADVSAERERRDERFRSAKFQTILFDVLEKMREDPKMLLWVQWIEQRMPANSPDEVPDET